MDTNKMRDLKALAEAATGGEWTCSEKHDGRFWHIQSGGQAIGATHAAGRKSPMAGIFEANAKFIAAASPATVLALLADIERLEASVRLAGVAGEMAVHQAVGRAATAFGVAVLERDQLKAENEVLRSAAMAAREFIMHEAEVRGLLDENGQVSHRHPRRQAAIASIDAAMAKEASNG